MNRNTRWILLLVVAALALGAGLWVRRGEEARLRRNIRKLTSQLEKSGPESALAAATRARSIADSFVAQPRFELPIVPYIPENRSELNSAIFQARSQVETLSIRIHDLAVHVAPDRQTAAMTLSATASVRMRSGAERASRAFEIDWRHEPDGWRIEAVRERQTLRRLPEAS